MWWWQNQPLIPCDDNVDLAEKIDNISDKCVFEDAVKFAAYSGPPSMFGSYVGFISLIDEKY